MRAPPSLGVTRSAASESTQKLVLQERSAATRPPWKFGLVLCDTALTLSKAKGKGYPHQTEPHAPPTAPPGHPRPRTRADHRRRGTSAPEETESLASLQARQSKGHHGPPSALASALAAHSVPIFRSSTT